MTYLKRLTSGMKIKPKPKKSIFSQTESKYSLLNWVPESAVEDLVDERVSHVVVVLRVALQAALHEQHVAHRVHHLFVRQVVFVGINPLT